MKKDNNKVKKVSPWGTSLRKLPWDKYDDITYTQTLISSTLKEWYDAKHRIPSDKEIKLINTKNIVCCPCCGSLSFVKNGIYKNKLQRYKCKDCNTNFSPLTNTIFDSKKMAISEWIEYLIHLFEFHSIKSSARDNRNSESTGKYWLIKVFSILKDIQNDVILEGNIYLDEMFFPVIKKDVVKKDSGKKLRGISRNKIAVATAFDDHGNYLMIVEYTSKPSDTSTWKALSKHIKEGSHLIHDGERSHGKLIRELSFTSEVYKTNITLGMKDEDNPLDPINNLHALSKRFIKAHGGYDRNNLQDWMNLVWFILSKPYNRFEKIERFISLALNSPQKVKYRDVMKKSAH